MNPERKAEWLRRLRSGEYDQTSGQLKAEYGSNVSYCCLGVACEMAREDGVGDYWSGNGYLWYGSHDDYMADGESGVLESKAASWATLPKGVSEWLGLDDSEGDPYVSVPTNHPKYQYLSDHGYLGPNNTARISQLNDNGFTFEQIADLIEAQF